MDSSIGEPTWRMFSDSHGYFHAEVPASWDVKQSEGAFTHSCQGRVWQGRRFLTQLLPPPGDSDARHTSVTIRIEEYAETPPPIARDHPELTTLSALRAYRVTHDTDWLICTVGNLRAHIEYEIQGVSGAYHPAGWELPPALSTGERHRRLALVQHIIVSLDLLPNPGSACGY